MYQATEEAGRRDVPRRPIPAGRAEALTSLGEGPTEIGAYAQARLALEMVAEVTADPQIQMAAVIHLIGLASIATDRVAFERHWAAARADRCRMTDDPAVEYHTAVEIGLTRFGELAQARDHLARPFEAADALAPNTWEYVVELSLEDLPWREAKRRKLARVMRHTAAVVIEGVEWGVREYRATLLL